MRRPVLTALALCMAPGVALACDDHFGKCEIEDWKHTYTEMMEALVIDGVTTCDAGEIRLRLYDGEGDAREFIGVETAYIDGHIFKAMLLQVEKPKVLSVKYSIEPM